MRRPCPFSRLAHISAFVELFEAVELVVGLDFVEDAHDEPLEHLAPAVIGRAGEVDPLLANQVLGLCLGRCFSRWLYFK